MGGQMMPTISISGFATQITTSKWFSMNTKTGIYIICTTRTTMQVVLDRARVSRLCRPLYGVRTHNTTRLCHMTSNNLSTRIFGTGFSFLSLSLSLSPSIQREFSVSRRAYKTSERFQNFNVALSPVAVMRIIANNFD